MLRRWLIPMTLVGLIVAGIPARAADAKQAKPAVVLAVRSLDAVIATGKYLATKANYGDLANQVEGIIKERVGEKGLEGINTKKPFGIYATDFGANKFVALVPIANEKALFALLKELNFEPEKGKNGIYKISPEFLPGNIYFRLANGYAYVTALSDAALAKDKLLPTEVVSPQGKGSLVSATVNFQQIPNAIKQVALKQVNNQLKKLQDAKGPNESAEEAKLRRAVLKNLAGTVQSIITDGSGLSLQLGVDAKAHKFSTALSFTGKSGSELSKQIASLGKASSLFAGIDNSEAAFAGLLHLALPDSIRSVIEPMIDDGVKKALDREKDANKKALAESLFKALAPTLKAGELDVFATLRGPSLTGKYTGLFAVKIKNGTDLAKAAREIITKATPASEKDRIKFDADKQGEVAIHQITLKGKLDKRASETLGEEPLYFAFRSDALFLTIGEKGLETLKAALAAKPKSAPMVRVQVALSRLVPLILIQHKKDELAKTIKEVFKDDKDTGKIILTVAGGDSLEARVSVTTSVFKLLALAAKGGSKPDLD